MQSIAGLASLLLADKTPHPHRCYFKKSCRGGYQPPAGAYYAPLQGFPDNTALLAGRLSDM